MSCLEIQFKALSLRLSLLKLSIDIQAMSGIKSTPRYPISEKPWQDWQESDYSSAYDYCGACLLDKNDLIVGGYRQASVCYLPVIGPDKDGINLDGVIAAQDTILDSESDVSKVEHFRKEAAQKLVKLMKRCELRPDKALLELAGIE